jgi:hypothetical protein
MDARRIDVTDFTAAFTPAVPEEVITNLRKQLDSGAADVRVDATLPAAVAAKVVRLLELENGKGAIVIPARSEYSPNDAARLLEVPRATVMARLRAGQFDGARQVGAHWRIPAESILTAMERDAEERRAALSRVSRLSAEIEARNTGNAR